MTNVQVDVFADPVLRIVDQMERRLSTAGLRLFAYRHLAPAVRERVIARFQAEGDDASGRWQRLAEATGRIRSKQGFPAWRPINVRTGALRAYVQTSTVRGSGTNSVTLTFPGRQGTAILREKLMTAQMGGKQGPGMSKRAAPPRPVLALGVRDSMAAEESLLDWIRRGGL